MSRSKIDKSYPRHNLPAKWESNVIQKNRNNCTPLRRSIILDNNSCPKSSPSGVGKTNIYKAAPPFRKEQQKDKLTALSQTMTSEALLWVDKYRPATFDDLTYHDELTERLRHLSSSFDMPHLLFYGPSGAGKRTRVGCVLRNLFASGVDKKRVVHRVFKVGDSGTKQVEVTTVASAHHIEVNPSESGLNDRLVVQELIKDMASTAPLGINVLLNSSANNVQQSGKQQENNENTSSGNTNMSHLKVIVLHEVDQMTRLAQQALRRTMERYAATCRIIMVSDRVSHIIEPLRSRCLGIRVGYPNEAQVCQVLRHVATREGIMVPDELMSRLYETSGRGNLRRAILQMEATRVSTGSLNLPPDAAILLGDWEYACQDAARLLTRDPSAQQLVAVRKRFQELLSHAVPAQIVLNVLVSNILKIADDEIGPEVCRVAAKFDHNLARGTKPIFHLEAFAARFMQIYHRFLQQVAMID